MANKRQRKKNIKSQKPASPQRGFRLSQNEQMEYNRQKKLVNAKMKRIENKFGEGKPLLMEAITKEGLRTAIPMYADELFQVPNKDEFGSRKEFNEWVKKAENFRKQTNSVYKFKENANGLVASERLLADIKKDTNEAIIQAKKKAEEYRDLPVYAGGHKQDMTQENRMAMMGNRNNAIGVNIPEKFDFDKYSHWGYLIEKVETMNKKSKPDYYVNRNEQLMDNWIKLLKESFNSDASKELLDQVMMMHPDDFYELYLMMDEFKFENYYEMRGVVKHSTPEELEVLEEYLTAFNNGELDLWGKYFPNSF